MLDCLPEHDKRYYSEEENVVDWSGKPSHIYEELVERYVFVGGSEDEYVKYWHRKLLTNMWK